MRKLATILIIIALCACRKPAGLQCDYHFFSTPKDTTQLFMLKYLDRYTDTLRPLTCVTCGYQIQ